MTKVPYTHFRSGKPRRTPLPKLRFLIVRKGWRLRELSEHFGLCRQTLLNHIREQGIPYNYNRGSPGRRNGSWKGGISKLPHKGPDGYWIEYKPNHPQARKAGYVLRSRLVMEKKLGRYLFPSEVVHHKNGNIDDNQPSNLHLYSNNGEHLAETLKGKVPKWTEDGKRRIAEGVRRRRARRNKPNLGQSRSDAAPTQQSSFLTQTKLRKVP